MSLALVCEIQLTFREMAEKIAAEEEKKRKRAEKFGTGKPASTTNGSDEPVSCLTLHRSSETDGDRLRRRQRRKG